MVSVVGYLTEKQLCLFIYKTSNPQAHAFSCIRLLFRLWGGMRKINLTESLAGADALALFSGGLDSILAARLVQDQGLTVRCLHFISPFFGFPERVPQWEELYGLTIVPVDVGDEFVNMLRNPPHGVGSVINPCVDCKILMLSRARQLLLECGAKILVTGEVLGQRPMSQRRDTLNIIRRDAGVRPYLLRPLCAKLLDPTEAEISGLVDREKLLDISGRGRKKQLELAKNYGFKELPTPGGGCLLTEKENARSYWPVLAYKPFPDGNDLRLAGTGRQYWEYPARQTEDGGKALRRWLCIGRNQADNDALQMLARPGDLVFKTRDFPGPVAIGRQFSDEPWPDVAVFSAAAFVASFSPKAVRAGGAASMRVHLVKEAGGQALDAPAWKPENEGLPESFAVVPDRNAGWKEYAWEEVAEEIRAVMR